MNKNILKKYSCECIGTFFLCFIALATGNPLAIGLMLAIIVFLGSNISFGHFNPAITFAQWLRGNFPLLHVPGYILSQTLGAFAAGALFFYLFGKIVFPAPTASLSTLKAIVIEGLGTFIFCMTCLEVARTKNNSTVENSIIIGLALATVAFMGGAYSGGAFNPAIGAGPILFDLLKGGIAYKFLPIYLIGPLTGGLFAALIHREAHTE